MGILKKAMEINISAYERQDKLKKHEELWEKIKDLIRSTSQMNNSDDYDKKHINIKFN